MIYDLKAPYFTSITATEIDHFELTPETGSVLICKVQRMAKWWEQSAATNVARV